MNKKSALIGPLMVDIPGQALTAEDREVLAHPLVGGVILFTRNYRDTAQLRELCTQILAIKTSPRLLLAVDHEGGRVQRFRVGFSRIPPMRTLGQLCQQNRAQALEEAQAHGHTIGTELAAYGIDLPFAPVLDIDHGVSGVIGDRAFASDCPTLIDLARAFRTGLKAAGISATGKHFPGHGAVLADSHLELPVDQRDYATLEKTELQPFVALCAEGIESLMMAHVRYTAVDEIPASLSHIWIRDILRTRMRYDGAIFCDDLSMGGAAVVGTLEDRARMALAAGCDMLPVCNDRPGVLTLLAALADVKPDAVASARLAKLYRREA